MSADLSSLGKFKGGILMEIDSSLHVNATEDERWPGNHTYDSGILAQCERSPFLLCSPAAPSEKTDRTFRVAWLRPPPWMPSRTFHFSACKYSNCEFQGRDISEQTDLVVVYVVGLEENYSPPRRWPHQLYAAFTCESPHHTYASFLRKSSSVWNYAFNMTLTYRTDADIFVPYGRLKFEPKPLKDRPDYYDITKNKTRPVTWFVSNCRTPSKREEYVKEMKKYINVDIFGGCGQPCSKDSQECLEEASRQYKFYLSFENSLCTDYVTEKFFKLFAPSMHIIPVVRGGAKYEKYFPQNTFINADNFTSAKELALHLKTLAGDLHAYSKLLEHKDMFTTINDTENRTACDICALLNTKKDFRKVYDMKAWMFDGHCLEPHDI